MDARSVISALFDEAFAKKAWHGPNLWQSVKGVTARQAAWRPAPGRHNIWEETLHAAYWKYAVRRRLEGSRRGRFVLKGSNFFPRPEPGKLSEAAWAADKAILLHEQGTAQSYRQITAQAALTQARSHALGRRPPRRVPCGSNSAVAPPPWKASKQQLRFACRVLMKLAHNPAQLAGRLLKEPDGGNTSGAGAQAIRSVCGRDAADGQDRDMHRAADARQPFHSLRRPVVGFRWRPVDRAEINVIGAPTGRAQSRSQRMARNSDQEFSRAVRGKKIIPQAACFSHRDAIFTQVHAARAARQRHIHTVVHQHARG